MLILCPIQDKSSMSTSGRVVHRKLEAQYTDLSMTEFRNLHGSNKIAIANVSEGSILQNNLKA